MIRPYNDVDFHAFVDDQVGPDRREAIAAYLKTSPSDAARVALWRRQNEAIKGVFADATSEAVPLWLTVGQVASGHDRPISLPKRAAEKSLPAAAVPAPPGTLNRGGLPPFLVAGLAFVIGAFAPPLVARLPGLDGLQWAVWDRDARQTFSARALEAHETFTLDPDHSVDVLDKPEGSLREWLERRVPVSVRVPDLSIEGWTLKGGRIAPGDLGPGALLIYQRGAGDRLSVYSGRLAAGFGAKEASVVDGKGVLSWSEGDVGYAVASTLPAPWLVHHTDELRSAISGDAFR